MKNLDQGRPSTLSLSEKAFHAGEEMGMQLLFAAHKEGGGLPDSVYAVGSLAIGALMILAAAVAKQEAPPELKHLIGKKSHEMTEDDKEDLKKHFDPHAAVTPEVLLFTAFLLNKMCRAREGANVVTEFGPFIVYEALEAFELFTGKKVDDKLVPGMVKAARDAGAVGKDALDSFISKMKNSPQAPNTLN